MADHGLTGLATGMSDSSMGFASSDTNRQTALKNVTFTGLNKSTSISTFILTLGPVSDARITGVDVGVSDLGVESALSDLNRQTALSDISIRGRLFRQPSISAMVINYAEIQKIRIAPNTGTGEYDEMLHEDHALQYLPTEMDPQEAAPLGFEEHYKGLKTLCIKTDIETAPGVFEERYLYIPVDDFLDISAAWKKFLWTDSFRPNYFGWFLFDNPDSDVEGE